uniref:Uncharacterized protein n=1 Tax=Anguilla anguilla TaxID=7936 RepID=A0A0E9VH21_ANGAN
MKLTFASFSSGNYRGWISRDPKTSQKMIKMHFVHYKTFKLPILHQNLWRNVIIGAIQWR